MKEYIEFVKEALFGDSVSEIDKMFKRNEEKILSSAKLMREKFKVNENVLYRGVILDNKLSNTLKPLPDAKFLSFTEDYEIAKNFANINNDLAKYLVNEMNNPKGFIIEHIANLDEILFHYSWAELIGLDMYFNEEVMLLIQEQKEVILEQRGRTFNLKKVS
jgi:hypothetical protein